MKKAYFVFFLLLLGAALPAGQTRTYTQKELSQIACMVTRVLERNHYSRQKLDAALSRRFFDEYFDTLDPLRLFFSEADKQKFAGCRDTLGQKLRAGDASFAFRVYDIYRIRCAQYRDFAEKALQKGFDFTVDETFRTDRSKAPRPADRKEQQELWRKKIKNDLLLYRLTDRALAEEREENKNKEKNAEEKKAEQEEQIARKWAGKTPEEKIRKRLRDFSNDVNKRDKVDILGLLLNALAQTYGSHSNYNPPKLDEDFEIHMSLSLTGIGATLTSDDGFIKVVELIPGGPAAIDGRLQNEDRIIAVTQEDGTNTDLIDVPVSQAVQYIRGPAKSKVTLTVLPGKNGRNGKPVQITLVRAKVNLAENEAKGETRLVTAANGSKHKVGLLTLPSFYMDFEAMYRGEQNVKRASSDVRRILKNFEQEKVESVVVDLRSNGGGSLPDAIALTGLFITTGPVVQVRDGLGRIELESDEDPQQFYKGPLVLLISKLSASSTEIFTSALRDCSRAIIVGDSRTFGKGTVLAVEQLDRHTALLGKGFPAGSATVESAMFFRTAGGSVQQLGITPDIVLPSLTEEMKIGEMFLDHHLPWDSIAPVPRTAYDPELSTRIAALRKLSEKRIAADPEYSRLRKQIAIYKRYRDRETVSLNEKKRWEEYKNEKKTADEADALLQDAPDKKKKKTDPVLREALHIGADYAELLQKQTAK